MAETKKFTDTIYNGGNPNLRQILPVPEMPNVYEITDISGAIPGTALNAAELNSIVPSIRDGNWYIGEVDQRVRASGADGFLGFELGSGQDTNGGMYTEYSLNAVYLGDAPKFKHDYAEDSGYTTTTIILTDL